jgi:hypothetical protein
MNNINEIYQDIIANSDALLQLLSPHTATNETPEGRIIFQCRWLKEQAQAEKMGDNIYKTLSNFWRPDSIFKENITGPIDEQLLLKYLQLGEQP